MLELLISWMLRWIFDIIIVDIRVNNLKLCSPAKIIIQRFCWMKDLNRLLSVDKRQSFRIMTSFLFKGRSIGFYPGMRWVRWSPVAFLTDNCVPVSSLSCSQAQILEASGCDTVRTSRQADSLTHSIKICSYNQHTVAVKFLGYETVTLTGQDLLELKTVRHAN